MFAEVRRVLRQAASSQPAEEPLRRPLTMRLYRAPYEAQMSPLERRLFQWGLLGYFAQDVMARGRRSGSGLSRIRPRCAGMAAVAGRYFAETRFLLYVGPERVARQSAG